KELVSLAERTIDVAHMRAALQVQNGIGNTGARCAGEDAGAGEPVGIIGWAQQTRLFIQILEYLALVKAMIAAGENVESERKQLFSNGRRDAESAGAIFRVGDGEIDPMMSD